MKSLNRRLWRGTLGLAVLAAAVFAVSQTARAYPEPEIVTKAWQLEFKFERPRVIAVQLPGEKRPTLFWYMTYTVTNKTGEDQLFIPDIQILSDAGDLVKAGKGVPPLVFNAIKAEQRDPLLMSPIQVSGKLLQGEDNAKSSVAIWPVPDHDVDLARIFVGGLSGETKEWKDPYSTNTVFLRKTLMVEYKLVGDAAHVTDKVPQLSEKKWVMR